MTGLEQVQLLALELRNSNTVSPTRSTTDEKLDKLVDLFRVQLKKPQPIQIVQGGGAKPQTFQTKRGKKLMV